MARGGGGSRGGGSRGGGGFSSGSARSSRGFSSSSSRSSFSSGSRGGSSYSSMNRGPRPSMNRGSRPSVGGGPRPSFNMGYRPITPRPPVYRPRAPRRTVYVSRPRSGVSGGGGCLSSVGTFLVVAIILMILFGALSSSGDHTPNYQDGTRIESTVEREPLPAGSVKETGYYTDNLGWINRSTTLTNGMKSFYKETGVQPYLYLADEDEVVKYGSLQNLAEAMYDELFTDEAHFLFAYTENASYEWEIWFVTGSQATAVIDTEAEEIIYQYFVRYYESDLSDEEFFAKIFEDSGELMMKEITNGFDVAKTALLVVGGIGVVGIVVYGINKNRKIKLEEQKEQNEFTEKMMNVPLEKFSEAQTDKELEELMKKYNESESK